MNALAELFRLGGPLMWPLALCSALLMAFLIERAITVSNVQWTTDDRQRTLHRRHLQFFVEVAPALGLLGTMHGIIECFKIVGGSGPSMSALQGLGIACITTVYGLVIALVAQVATYVLDSLARSQADGTVARRALVTVAATAAVPRPSGLHHSPGADHSTPEGAGGSAGGQSAATEACDVAPSKTSTPQTPTPPDITVPMATRDCEVTP